MPHTVATDVTHDHWWYYQLTTWVGSISLSLLLSELAGLWLVKGAGFVVAILGGAGFGGCFVPECVRYKKEMKNTHTNQ